MNPVTPQQLEAMLKDADENGANYIVPINWRWLGPKFLALWRAAERHGHDDFEAWKECDICQALKALTLQ